MKRCFDAFIVVAAVFLTLLAGCEVGRAVSYLRASPNGRWFGVLIQEQLYCYDLPTRQWREYETPPFTERRFSWAPDGRSLVFASDTKGWDLDQLDLGSGQTKVVAPHLAKDCWPVWSPGGNLVHFVSYRGLKPDIWSLEVATGAQSS